MFNFVFYLDLHYIILFNFHQNFLLVKGGKRKEMKTSLLLLIWLACINLLHCLKEIYAVKSVEYLASDDYDDDDLWCEDGSFYDGSSDGLTKASDLKGSGIGGTINFIQHPDILTNKPACPTSEILVFLCKPCKFYISWQFVDWLSRWPHRRKGRCCSRGFQCWL